MVVLLGLDFVGVIEVVEVVVQGEVCQVVNDNDSGQVVVFGYKVVVECVVEIVKEKGVKCVVLLLVLVLFYCVLMQLVVDVMVEVLFYVDINVLKVLVVVNVVVLFVNDLVMIWFLLVEQVMGFVCWCELVSYMSEVGVMEIYEIGVGKVLLGMVCCIDCMIVCMVVGMFDDVKVVVEKLV